MNTISESISGEFQMKYQEEELLTESSESKLTIGVLKEDFEKEKRVPLTPYTVKFLTNNGIKVFIERGAGDYSFFTDVEYSDAGAEILDHQKEVFNCDVIIKVAPPNEKQMSYLKKHQILISTLNIKTLKKEFFQQLSSKKITAIAFEYIKDELGSFPFVNYMSRITGELSISIASNYLLEKKGKLIAGIGGNKPSEIVIIGSGDIAKSAAKTAINAGAIVKVFDNSIAQLKSLEESVSGQIYTSVLYPSLVKKEIARADILIGALSNNSNNENSIISKSDIKSMKKGSLVIDLSIDQGSCFENSVLTTLKKPLIEKNGITYYGVPNSPSTASRTASYVLGNIFLQQFSNFNNYRSVNHFLKNDIDFRNGLYLYKGVLVNDRIGKNFNLPTQDLNLIMAAF